LLRRKPATNKSSTNTSMSLTRRKLRLELLRRKLLSQWLLLRLPLNPQPMLSRALPLLKVRRLRVIKTKAPLTTTTTRRATEVAEVAVAVSAEARAITSESITPMRRALLLSRMRRTITTITPQEDTRMPPEVDSVEEEVATRKTVRETAEVVEAVVADLGLLKNIEIKVR
jgi:hypothetical protein